MTYWDLLTSDHRPNDDKRDFTSSKFELLILLRDGLLPLWIEQHIHTSFCKENGYTWQSTVLHKAVNWIPTPQALNYLHTLSCCKKTRGISVSYYLSTLRWHQKLKFFVWNTRIELFLWISSITSDNLSAQGLMSSAAMVLSSDIATPALTKIVDAIYVIPNVKRDIYIV